jgi:hypothetical protein
MTDTYAESWRQYKKLRNRVLFVLLSPIIFYLLVGILVTLTLAPKNFMIEYGMLFWWLWIIAFLIVTYRLGAWICPNCKKAFLSYKTHRINLLTNKCVHCGLPKYASSDTPNT